VSSYHQGHSEKSYYVKPLPLILSPWSTGIVAGAQNGTSGSFAFATNDALAYVVYEQAGETPASSDIAVATIALVAGGNESGPGRYAIEVTAIDGDEEPVAGVAVWLDGSAKIKHTDQFGRATLYAEPGEYELRSDAPFGFDAPAATDVTVGNEDTQATIALMRTSHGTPSNTAMTRLTIRAADQSNVAITGTVSWSLVTPGVIGDSMHANAMKSQAIVNGVASIDLLRNQTYEITSKDAAGNVATVTRTMPNVDACTLSMTVG
jgi:hypothetical protein